MRTGPHKTFSFRPGTISGALLSDSIELVHRISPMQLSPSIGRRCSTLLSFFFFSTGYTFSSAESRFRQVLLLLRQSPSRNPVDVVGTSAPRHIGEDFTPPRLISLLLYFTSLSSRLHLFGFNLLLRSPPPPVFLSI